jgi:hypothetical protein
MASRRPNVIRHGTARDASDHAVGYTASGASEHSRHAANGSASTKKPEPEKVVGASSQAGREHGRGKRNRWQLIQEMHRDIAKIARRLKTETDPEVLARLRKNYTIKSGFLSKLHKQRIENEKPKHDAKPPSGNVSQIEEPEEWYVETIPGEYDIEPF